ncbi:PASTA domain-containing protein [Curtobacterium flaccumfaciens]
MVFFVANLQPGKPPVSSSVSVPNVAGSTYSAAASAIEKKSLKPVKVEENSDSVDKGTVIRTDPGSGVNVGRNQNVNVVVSLGPERVPVPELNGQSQAAAQQSLDDAGFRLGAISSDYSADVPEGTVLSSTPSRVPCTPRAS